MGKSTARMYASVLMQADPYRHSTEIQKILAIFLENPQLYEIFQSPRISLLEKKKTAEMIFKSQVKPLVYNFLQLLIENHRIKMLKEIYDDLIEYENDREGILTGRILSVFVLDENMIEMIEKRFSIMTHKKVQLTQEIDLGLIGGLIVILGDAIYDGSIQGKLNDIKEHMLRT